MASMFAELPAVVGSNQQQQQHEKRVPRKETARAHVTRNCVGSCRQSACFGVRHSIRRVQVAVGPTFDIRVFLGMP